MKKRFYCAWLTATLCCWVIQAANGASIPHIHECGLTTNRPAMPVYRLKNTPLKEVIRGGEAMHDGKITLHLEGRGEILLQQYFYNPEPGADVDRAAQVDWDYVAGRQVALGWLAGATNLLLVRWRDLSESHGTGRCDAVVPGCSS